MTIELIGRLINVFFVELYLTSDQQLKIQRLLIYSHLRKESSKKVGFHFKNEDE